ncbi:glycerol-3-phosphate phosphatase [Drosophila persimilis]|uniref:Glycerol-3-phosphate phosphatase n=1 Tax=Drosophila pseudoobscura pseudoobscura TaxID=46245 RepID=Q2LZ19_DROPS|nr:glycerol-3-phosphate phosphatase [Drosophila pseudoobscura]XP_026847835.1 glycerol-3-phosphate phosphatase [Drosophila persimilis]
MLEGGTINMLDLSGEQVSEWLRSFDTVLSDGDGTIWQDDTAIEGAAAVLNALQNQFGKRVYLITNNGLKTRRELFERAQRLGFQVPNDQHIISPTATIVDHLKQLPDFDSTKHKVFVVGNAAIGRELQANGIDSYGAGEEEPLPMGEKWQDFALREFTKPEAADNVGAVVVGWDEHFSYCKMARASHILCRNGSSAFLVTNRDAVHKYPALCIPGTAAFVAGIEACAGREALEMGKPSPVVLEPLIQSGALRPERTLMIGDCPKIDIAFARNCGMQSLLVGTGSYQLDILQQNGSLPQPDLYLPRLGDLLQFL